MDCLKYVLRLLLHFAAASSALLLAGYALCAQNADAAKKHAEAGLSLARERKLHAAEQELRVAVALRPQVAIFYAQLASVQGLAEKWHDAIRNFEQAVALEPENPAFRRELAAVQWQQGELEAAEKNIRYLLERTPDDGGAMLLLGLVNETKGSFAEAAEQLNSQFDRAAAEPTLAVKLFNAAMRSGNKAITSRIVAALLSRSADPAWQGAVAKCSAIASVLGDLQAAEKLFSSIPAGTAAAADAGYATAVLYYRSGQTATAERLLQTLIDGQLGNAANQHRLLALCYVSRGDMNAARSEMESALQSNASDLSMYEDFIAMETTAGNPQNAARLRDRLVKAFPQHAEAWVLRGNSELRSGLNKEAIESYVRAEKLSGSSPEPLLGKADAYFLSGDRDQALLQCKRAVAKFPKDARGFLTYAKIVMDSAESETAGPEAERLLTKALELDSKSSAAHYLLARLAMTRGQNNGAETELARAIQLDANRSDAHFALASVYRRLNRKEDAAREFAEFQRLKQIEESAVTLSVERRE